MSAKTTGLVWDMPCPQEINGILFKDNHKYVLLAYADHADHFGKNIYPAVHTIAVKTGYKDRNVQYITRDLEEMGVLVEDGIGPRGTNRWLIPYDEGGAKIAPLQKLQGAKSQKSLGAIPSGAIPSGANNAPDFKEPEPLNIKSPASELWEKIYHTLEPDLNGNARTYVQSLQPVSFQDGILILGVENHTTLDWMESRMKQSIKNILPGVVPDGAAVEFVVVE